ncbi:hypothetical protein niasHT_004079 [Heterodera trifolii]|uniref:Uncharacterized protein n=1 Tax=Heterodera trifolii TaxID=157864 RepID=A0ABD2LTK0_9BILA
MVLSSDELANDVAGAGASPRPTVPEIDVSRASTFHAVVSSSVNQTDPQRNTTRPEDVPRQRYGRGNDARRRLEEAWVERRKVLGPKCLEFAAGPFADGERLSAFSVPQRGTPTGDKRSRSPTDQQKHEGRLTRRSPPSSRRSRKSWLEQLGPRWHDSWSKQGTTPAPGKQANQRAQTNQNVTKIFRQTLVGGTRLNGGGGARAGRRHGGGNRRQPGRQARLEKKAVPSSWAEVTNPCKPGSQSRNAGTRKWRTLDSGEVPRSAQEETLPGTRPNIQQKAPKSKQVEVMGEVGQFEADAVRPMLIAKCHTDLCRTKI